MKKKIEILGRKVPILAVMMAILIIGTASAAVFLNYATLSGNATVGSSVSVFDSGDIDVTGTITGVLDFNSPATFTIKNTGDVPVTVELAGTIDAVEPSPVDTEGLSITYAGVDVTTDGDITTVIVPTGTVADPGISTITVTLEAVPNIQPGTYTVTVTVNPPTV